MPRPTTSARPSASSASANWSVMRRRNLRAARSSIALLENIVIRPRSAHVARPQARHRLRHAARRQGCRAVVAALNQHANSCAAGIAGALRQMKFTPDLRFRLDTSLRRGSRIDALLQSPEVAARPRRDGTKTTTTETTRQRMSGRGKKKGRPISGWLVLDKPVGMTSTEAVGLSSGCSTPRRRATPVRSIRWRPALPIALGEATKTVPYVRTAARSIASPSAGARRPPPTTPRARSRPPTTPGGGRDPRGAAEFTGEIMQGRRLLRHQDRRRTRLRSRPRGERW